ncbi:MAG: hypothetical protein EXR79_05540 [Myxococcales bacterium]|nr:hypothetical protein [Myxococcales bacterium]
MHRSCCTPAPTPPNATCARHCRSPSRSGTRCSSNSGAPTTPS